MKILLTGATGYIGSQLTHRLIIEGYEVSILVRPESRLDIFKAVLPKISVYIYDGSYLSLVNALNIARPDIVCHLASLFLAQHTSEDVGRLVEANLSFPTKLMEAMDQTGNNRLINTGTSWQHYKNEAYNPVNLYAATKQAFQSLLDYYIQARCFRVITLKLFDTYGPGDTRAKLFSLLRKAARTGEALRMSPGEQLLDFVYIDDVLDAFILAIELLAGVEDSKSYAVSNPKRVSLLKLVEIYRAIVGRPLLVQWGGLPYRPREVMQPWSDYITLPGWRPKVDLREGILRMERDSQINGLLAGPPQ